MMSFLAGAGDSAAAYQLGRQSAESDALRRDLLDTLFSPAGSQPDATVLAAQIRALAAENAQLREQLGKARLQLADVERDYAELDAWADIAAKKLKQHGL